MLMYNIKRRFRSKTEDGFEYRFVEKWKKETTKLKILETLALSVGATFK